MTTEKLRFFAYLGASIISLGVILFTLGKYILPVTVPFAIAGAVALAVHRPAAFLSSKLRVPERILRPMLALVIALGIIFIFGWGIFAILSEAWGFLSSAAENGALVDLIDRISSAVGGMLAGLGLDGEMRNEVMQSLSGVMGSALSSVASSLSSFAASVPRGIFFIVVTSVATVYFAADLGSVISFIKRLLPTKAYEWLRTFKEQSLTVLLKYLRAYALIMLLTFAIVFFGMSLLGIEYAFLISVVISLLDILPIIGVGVILVPYGAVLLLMGNTFRGIGILVLAAVCYVVRQIAEPRILGKNLGIHPLLTLILMYAGYALLGIGGMIIFPVIGVAASSAMGYGSGSKSTMPPTS